MRTVVWRPLAPIVAGMAVFAVLTIVIFVVVAGQKPQAGSATATPSPTQMPAPTEPLATPGQLARGIPTTFGGQPVLRGSQLNARIRASADGASFLAGGWLHKDPPIYYCAIFLSDPAVEPCNGVALYPRAHGGKPIWIGPGEFGLLPRNYRQVTRPIVVRIHTHDTRCSLRDHGCELRPVVLQVVWLGPVT